MAFAARIEIDRISTRAAHELENARNLIGVLPKKQSKRIHKNRICIYVVKYKIGWSSPYRKPAESSRIIFLILLSLRSISGLDTDPETRLKERSCSIIYSLYTMFIYVEDGGRNPI